MIEVELIVKETLKQINSAIKSVNKHKKIAALPDVVHFELFDAASNHTFKFDVKLGENK